MALTTEAQPLMPQAQGIQDGRLPEITPRPSGKGMPIRNARGAINKADNSILNAPGSCTRPLKSTGKKST